MKKLFYIIIALLAFTPLIVSYADFYTETPCDTKTTDENGRDIKVCYLDLVITGNSKFQTLKGQFTLTNTTFKVTPQAGDSRIKATDNGNYHYTFSATTPISNQKVRLAKFTMYLSQNGQNCSIVWNPDEKPFSNAYCEYKDGNYYDLNGNIVSETEFKKQCEKHSCEVVDGNYYGKDGNVISESEYNKTCNKHYCEVVDGTYFGKDGNSVTATEYKKQCEKHYCEVVDGTYYDKNGNSVSKVEYTKSCSTPTCKVIEGKYYDKNSKIVSAAEYDKQCNVHYCKIIDNTYFGKNGNSVDKATWDSECTTTVPDTGGFFSIGTVFMGITTLIAMAFITKKINVVKKI